MVVPAIQIHINLPLAALVGVLWALKSTVIPIPKLAFPNSGSLENVCWLPLLKALVILLHGWVLVCGW